MDGGKGGAGGWFRWVVQSLYAVRCGGVGWGVVVSKALVGLGFCRLCARCGAERRQRSSTPGHRDQEESRMRRRGIEKARQRPLGRWGKPAS